MNKYGKNALEQLSSAEDVDRFVSALRNGVSQEKKWAIELYSKMLECVQAYSEKGE